MLDNGGQRPHSPDRCRAGAGWKSARGRCERDGCAGVVIVPCLRWMGGGRPRGGADLEVRHTAVGRELRGVAKEPDHRPIAKLDADTGVSVEGIKRAPSKWSHLHRVFPDRADGAGRGRRRPAPTG
jgi:hypothetical protein